MKNSNSGTTFLGGEDKMKKVLMISLPDTVEWIGQQAFISCTAVEELVLPESVKELRNGTFAGSFLRKIHVPSSVTYLDSHTFSMCDWLERITGTILMR